MGNESIMSVIEEFLRKMTVDFESIEITDNGINTTFLIKTKDAGILIGNRGETLEALGTVIRKIVQRRMKDMTDKHTFVVDVNNYQTKRLEEFRHSLKTSADRVRLFKEAVELSPMTSYERMIVHTTFSNDPDIETESQGEGKFRRVILKHSVRKTSDQGSF